MTARDWTVVIPADDIPRIAQTKPGPLHETAGELVGGYIEPVRVLGLAVVGYLLIVDEEGLLDRKPHNALASYLYGEHLHGRPIVGDAVVVCETETPEGPDLAWLTQDEAEQLLAQLLVMTARGQR